MKKIKYCIVGGGVAGIGFIDGLSQRGEKDFVLFEGRQQLAYTLNWMPYAKRESKQLGLSMTGVEFKRYLVNNDRDLSKISFSSRLLDVDKKNKIIFVNFNGERTEQIKYEKLVIAVGGLQILYGSYLLPGFRGAGIFTTYQTGEMLTEYNFLPGKKLFILGRCQYSYETAILAQKRGIETTIGSTGEFAFRDGKTPVYENIEILEVLGEKDKRMTGIKFLSGNKEVMLEADSMAVDGKFIIEHKMRDILGIEWGLDTWRARLERGFFLNDDVALAGDANKPDYDFTHQYEKAFNLAKEF